MNQKKGIKVGFIASAIVLLVVAVAVPARAGDLNRMLTGVYASNFFNTCAWSPLGFKDDLGRKPDAGGKYYGTNVSSSTQGVSHYDGIGRYKFTGEVLSVTNETAGSLGPAQYPVAQYEMVCEGNYEVDKYLQVINSDGECTLTAKAGQNAPNKYFKLEISNMESEGQLIGTMGNILSLRTVTEPNVEIVDIYTTSNTTPTLTSYRICTGSGMAMKLVGPARELRKQGE